MHEHNPYYKQFKSIINTPEYQLVNIKLLIKNDKNTDRRRYEELRRCKEFFANLIWLIATPKLKGIEIIKKSFLLSVTKVFVMLFH